MLSAVCISPCRILRPVTSYQLYCVCFHLQVFSAICVVFAHGAGEVGFMAGPLSCIYDVYMVRLLSYVCSTCVQNTRRYGLLPQQSYCSFTSLDNDRLFPHAKCWLRTPAFKATTPGRCPHVACRQLLCMINASTNSTRQCSSCTVVACCVSSSTLEHMNVMHCVLCRTATCPPPYHHPSGL